MGCHIFHFVKIYLFFVKSYLFCKTIIRMTLKIFDLRDK